MTETTFDLPEPGTSAPLTATSPDAAPPTSQPRAGAPARLAPRRSRETPSVTVPDTSLGWALWAAARGWPVFQVQFRGKNPLQRHWQELATTDEDQIRKWFAGARRNIGIHCGRARLLVLDDDRLGDLAHLAEAHGCELPETFTVKTSKGQHAYFAAPEGVTIRNLTRPFDGYEVDVKCDGGLVVGPGSVHESGVVYEPTDLNRAVAPLPPPLIDLLVNASRPKPKPQAVVAQPTTRPATSDNADPVRSRASAQAALVREAHSVRTAGEGQRERSVNAAGLKLGRWVGGGWLAFEDAFAALVAAASETGWVDDENRQRSGTWAEDHIKRAIEDGMTNPHPGVPRDESDLSLDDSLLAEWLAERLGDRYCWAGGLGWHNFDGKVWRSVEHVVVREQTRREFKRLNKEEVDRCDGNVARLRALATLLTKSKIDKVTDLLKGILNRDASEFDAHPDLLNVGNGVIDLRTGELLPHSPDLLLTKITRTNYRPGAKHPDWDEALRALPDQEVVDWMQIRFGQAATGWTPNDDVMPVLKGGGENGKSTVVGAIMRALGDHAVAVPERALIANPSDHPTELMMFMGARLALLEEAPEGRRLNVKRLKDTVGTPTMTARRIRQDNVTWQATHSLFLTTNYSLQISETDHGTWRRLALVSFPFTFVKEGQPLAGPNDRRGNPTLRDRVLDGRQGQHEAVLAWVVEGARRWYQADRAIPAAPARVQADTMRWREETDQVLAFINERLVFDPSSMVLSTELFAEFRHWQESNGQPEQTLWADLTFTKRFEEHQAVTSAGVRKEKKRVRAETLSRRLRGQNAVPKNAVSVWPGLRFRSDRSGAQGEL